MSNKNTDIYLEGDLYVVKANKSVAPTKVIDSEGVLYTTVTATDFTSSGNTTIGDAATDTLTVTAQVVGDVALVKETDHTLSVATTTTAATAGGALALVGGVGATSGAGGAASLTGGVGGTSGAGGAATLKGGAAGTGSANAAGGQANVTGGAGQGTSAGGAIVLTSGASENGTAVSPGASGAITLAVGAAGTATTGTAGAGGAVAMTGAAGGASTGASSTAGAGSDASVTAGAGGASSGGGDTGGRGGNVVLTSGAAGSGATAGLAGMIFQRGPIARKSISTTATDTATLSAAQILSGTVRCTPTAAATYTMPTGTVLAAALPAAFTTGDCIDFVLVNLATNAGYDITVATAAGITLFGKVEVSSNAAVTDSSYGTFRCEMTGANAFNVIRIA